MKYLRKPFVKIVIIIAFIMLCCWTYFIAYPSIPGVKISETQLRVKTSSIARKYSGISTVCQVIPFGERLEKILYSVDHNSKNQLISDTKGNGRLLYFDATPWYITIKELPQLYSLFEIWLYVRDKELPFNITGILYRYSSGGIDSTYVNRTLVTKQEFDEIYSSTNIKGLSREEAAKKLAHIWIEKTGYVQTQKS